MVSHFMWERLLMHVSINVSLFFLFHWDWLIWNSKRHHGNSKDFVILFVFCLWHFFHSIHITMTLKCAENLWCFFFFIFFFSHLRKLYLDEEKYIQTKWGKKRKVLRLPMRWRLPIFLWNIINVKCILISDFFFFHCRILFDWSWIDKSFTNESGCIDDAQSQPIVRTPSIDMHTVKYFINNKSHFLHATKNMIKMQISFSTFIFMR